MPQNTFRTARNISSSGLMAPRGVRRLAAFSGPRAYSELLVFPGCVLAPLPPSGLADYLLLASVQDDDIELTVHVPYNADPGKDTMQLLIDGKPVGTPKIISGQPGDTFTITLSAAERKAAGEGPHRLNYEVYFCYGNAVEHGPGQSFVIDTRAPGEPLLGALIVEPDVVANGITPDVLKDDGQGGRYLKTIVPSYEGVQPGDHIYPAINGVAHTEAIPVDEKDSGQDVMLPFSEALLTNVPDGQIDLSYIIIDRAGNRSRPAVNLPLTKLINGQISDLEAPAFPLAADGLLDYADALVPVWAIIPGNDDIVRADSIVLTVGGTSLSAVSAPADGADGTPLMDILIPADVLYDEWAKITAAANQVAELKVSYRVLRGTLPAGSSPEVAVRANLHVPGGTPGPDPVHALLKAPTIISASGQFDRIPVGDSGDDATVIIPWRNTATPGEVVFEEGDIVKVAYGSGSCGIGDYRVTAADVAKAEDLKLTLLSDTIKQVGSGSIVTFYTVVRAIVGGCYNIVRAPHKNVEVVSSDDLPGGGKGLAAGRFAPLNDKNVIGSAEIHQGVTFTVPAYENQKTGAQIVLNFSRFQGSSHMPGEALIPESQWKHEIIAASDAGEHVFSIPQVHLITPALLSHTETTYSVRNAAGTAASAQKYTIIDPRGFSVLSREA